MKAIGGGSDRIKTLLQRAVKERFPVGVEASFAYGSAVFQQKGDINFNSNVVDMVLIVKNAEKWHEKNMKRNPDDYSMIKYFGSRFMTYLGNRVSAGIVYYPFIKFENLMLKYGVISKQKLLEDLWNWNYLYVAGRLHKPVLWLKKCDKVDEALKHNLVSALTVSLLNQPKKFCEASLYKDLCRLSYEGDFRTFFGLDTNKHSRIVDNNLENFRSLYSPYISKLSNFVKYDIKNKIYLKNNDIDRFLIRKLPKTLVSDIKSDLGLNEAQDLRNIERKVVNTAIRQKIKQIVFTSSFTQTVKGMATTSFSKSLLYLKEKMLKSFKFYNF